jgi:hypothetical protein
MGRAEIRFSLPSLEQTLQLPSGFSISNVQIHHETNDVIFIVTGNPVEHGAEYQGVFTTRIIEGEGQWTQGKWELAPTYYGTLDDLKRTLNLPELNSEATS